MKTTSPKQSEVPDIRADEPDLVMHRFNEGLRRVLAAPKHVRRIKRTKKRQR